MNEYKVVKLRKKNYENKIVHFERKTLQFQKKKVMLFL